MKRKSNLGGLFILEVLMGISLVVIFLKYPIFPAVLSGDFSQHMNTASVLARGVMPPFSSLVLYYGIEFYLALAVLGSPTVPLVSVRLAMGLLVLISPLIIYACVKQIFDSKAAIWTTAIYALSGFLWFGMVFNSGLWPNFWGLLSSLMLVSATVYFSEKRAGVFSLLLFIVTLGNALFSHYSILLAFPPLMLYLALKRNWLGFGILTAPLVVGFVLFPNLVFGLGAFVGASVGNIPQPTFLASIMLLPTLSFMVAEISVNFLGDFAALAVLTLGGYFLWHNWKTRNPKMFIFSAWFLIILLIPVYSSNAWRFAFIGLMPLTVMAGWSLSKLRPTPFTPNKKVFLFLCLFLTPVFGSWANSSFFVSSTDTSVVAAQQGYDLQAIDWMLAELPSNCDFLNATNCGIISANDSNFQYLSYMDSRHYAPTFNGLGVYYAPGSHVIFTDALQTQFFASQYGRYILVSMVGSDSAGPCDPRRSFGLSMTADSTSIKPNQTVTIDLKGLKGLNATVTMYDNGNKAVSVGLLDGMASVSTSYPKAGDHELILTLGSTSTPPLNIVVGSNPTPSPKSVSVTSDFCQPWYTYNPDTMRGWKITYENPQVRLYEVTV